ncbi:perosamine synthetase [Streptacidiphilus sp. MAP12-16]|uniref:DegT/DnrJ/EryC1/StrS family aminotransferase n=1 Tax=Streptacidiphilus sp. MAP12-16 TaxID=3156300 RepID=UPI003518EC05
MNVPAARVVFSGDDRSEAAAAVMEILAGGSLTLGPWTERFEAAFATAHAVPHAVGVCSGTAALEIALRIVGVADRDVVVPANTFYATAAAVLHAGGRPVFADVEATTFALSAVGVEAVLTPTTAAVVLVHVGGLITPEVDALRRLCDSRGIALIEDAAHAHGCTYQGRFAGSFGLAGAFSFYPTKLTTSGEGGMLVTDSLELRDEARVYRDQGKGSFTTNHHVRQGYSWRLSEVNAAIGEIHLRRLKEFIDIRREVASRFTAALAAMPGLEPLVEAPGCRSNFYKYMVLLPEGVDRALFKREVFERFDVRLPGEVYDLPLHRQPVLAEFADGPLPVAEDVCARHICLPIHSDMRSDEVDQVLSALSAVHADLIG